MTHEELDLEIKKLEGYISITRERISSLKELFINEHRKYADGQKVRVNFANFSEVGFIYGAKLSWNGGVRYMIKKMKKDGTASMNDIGIYGVRSIEIID